MLDVRTKCRNKLIHRSNLPLVKDSTHFCLVDNVPTPICAPKRIQSLLRFFFQRVFSVTSSLSVFPASIRSHICFLRSPDSLEWNLLKVGGIALILSVLLKNKSLVRIVVLPSPNAVHKSLNLYSFFNFCTYTKALRG